MKKALVFIALLLLSASIVVALPSNYNAPVLVANASVNADINRYADADGIVNGLTDGGNRLYGIKTGTAQFIVSSENGTTLKSQAYGVSTVFGMYYHDLEQKLYVDGTPQGRVEAWRMDNPLSPILNGTWIHSGNTHATIFDEAEDRMFMVPLNPELGIVISHSTANGWSEDSIPASFIVDRFSIGNDLYYAGGFHVGGGNKHFIVLDDNLDLVANVSAPSLLTFDGATYANLYKNHFFVIDSDFAIESNNGGSSSHLISINDFNDFSELAVGCGARFYPLDAYALDYIIGFDIDTDTFHICDATEITSITTEDTGVYIGYNETNVGNPNINILGGGRVLLGLNGEFLWDLGEQAAAGGAAATTNEPPVYTATFLGLTDDLSSFVFDVRLQDAEGGNAYYALNTYALGEAANATSSSTIDFDAAADLSFVTNTFCPDTHNITYSSPFSPFGNDGLLHINLSDCIYPSSVIFDTSASPLEAEDNITATTSLGWGTDSSGSYSSSVALYSSDGKLLDQVLFDYDVTSTTLNVSARNGTLMGTQNPFSLTGSLGIVVVESEIDFLTNTVRQSVSYGGGTIAEFTIPFYNPAANDFQEYVFNQYGSDWNTYVDYVSYYYVVEGPTSLPSYQTFGYLTPNNPISKAVYTDVGPFGEYEGLLYGSDTAHGTSYYEDPYFFSFTYNALTPTLSQSEIDDIIAAGGGVIDGDLATDYLPRMLESLGLTTTASRFILGFIIMLAIAFIVADFGAAIGILVMGAAFITLSIIGLFPIWFVTIMVIIAAVLVGVSLKKILAG